MPREKKVKEEAPKENVPMEPAPPKKKKKKWLKFLILFLVLVGIGAAIFFFRGRIATLVKDIPVLNQVFKVSEETEPVEEEVPVEVLKEQIAALEGQVSTLQTSLRTEEENNRILNDTISVLRQYEEEYTRFREQKEAWDEEVAKTDPSLFIEQFEAMYPDLAERLYGDFVVSANITSEQKAYARVVSEMETEQAARALEQLVSSEPELIKMIFASMNQEAQGAILSEMSSQYASQVLKLISPPTIE